MSFTCLAHNRCSTCVYPMEMTEQVLRFLVWFSILPHTGGLAKCPRKHACDRGRVDGPSVATQQFPHPLLASPIGPSLSYQGVHLVHCFASIFPRWNCIESNKCCWMNFGVQGGMGLRPWSKQGVYSRSSSAAKRPCSSSASQLLPQGFKEQGHSFVTLR